MKVKKSGHRRLKVKKDQLWGGVEELNICMQFHSRLALYFKNILLSWVENFI